MPLDPADEERLAAVEIFILALRDAVNTRADFDFRKLLAIREAAHTPEPEE